MFFDFKKMGKNIDIKGFFIKLCNYFFLFSLMLIILGQLQRL
jgi:hypothetical protein